MNFRHALFLIFASTFTGASLSAATITQTTPFSFTMSGAGDGTFTIVPDGAFTASVSPFDSSNGTLNSFEIMWSIAFSADGTAGGDPGNHWNPLRPVFDGRHRIQ